MVTSPEKDTVTELTPITDTEHNANGETTIQIESMAPNNLQSEVKEEGLKPTGRTIIPGTGDPDSLTFPWVTSPKPPTLDPGSDITMIVEVNGVACACIRIYSPVCGTDNKSYFNPCLLACEHGNDNPKVRVQYDGNCIPW